MAIGAVSHFHPSHTPGSFSIYPVNDGFDKPIEHVVRHSPVAVPGS